MNKFKLFKELIDLQMLQREVDSHMETWQREKNNNSIK